MNNPNIAVYIPQIYTYVIRKSSKIIGIFVDACLEIKTMPRNLWIVDLRISSKLFEL